MKNIFSLEVTNDTIARIKKLNPDTKNLWGMMSVDQMLAHCCVTYEMIYSDKHPKPNSVKIFLLKTFVKKIVVQEKPFARNERTAPPFVIADAREFEKEKGRLVEYLQKTQKLGESHFDGKESHSFGKMTVIEWNNGFYKHLDHHLSQFGV